MERDLRLIVRYKVEVDLGDGWQIWDRSRSKFSEAMGDFNLLVDQGFKTRVVKHEISEGLLAFSNPKHSGG